MARWNFYHRKIVSLSNLIFLDEFLQNLSILYIYYLKKKKKKKTLDCLIKISFPSEFQENSTPHLSQNNLKPLQYRKWLGRNALDASHRQHSSSPHIPHHPHYPLNIEESSPPPIFISQGEEEEKKKTSLIMQTKFLVTEISSNLT